MVMLISRIRSYILFLFVFLFLSLRVFDGLEQYITQVLTPIVLFLTLLITFNKIPVLGKLQWIYLLFFIWGVLTIVVITNFSNYTRVIRFFLGILTLMFIFNNLILTKENYIASLYGFLLGGLVISIDSIFISQFDLLNLSEANRISGSIGNSNTFGAIVLLTNFVAIILFFLKKLDRLFLLLISGLLIFLSIRSGSRSTFLSQMIIIGSSYYYYFRKDIKKLFVLLPLAFITFIYLFNLLLENTFLGYRFTTNSKSDNLREDLVLWGIDQIRSNPFFGLGLGNFQNSNPYGYYSHNDVIEVVTTTGIIGLILYVFFIIFFYNEYIVRGEKEIENENKFIFTSKSFLIIFLFSGLFKPLFMDVMFFMVLFIIYSYRKNYYLTYFDY